MHTLIPLLLIAAAAPPVSTSFSRDVAPMLRTHCLRCHSGPSPKGDLDLTTRDNLIQGGASGAALVPGKAAESLLFLHVRDGKMPPRSPLPASAAVVLRRWIDAGAVWQGPTLRPVAQITAQRAGADWWSLQPIRRPAIPAVHGVWKLRNPVDAFLLATLEKRGLTFSPEADRLTLLRRVTWDLTGLPPTLAETDAFLTSTRPDAYEQLVDTLLASPAYGERHGRHWLDVVRFAESHGYETNLLRRNAWPYRDWVIRAYNLDLPYQDFVRQQFVGDVLRSGDFLGEAATGFLVAGAHDNVGNATEEGRRQQRADDLHDIVSTTSSAFLGLTVGCARCHDHKFDPVTQKDFFALQALVSGVQHAERTISGRNAPDHKQKEKSLRDRIALLDRELDDLEPLAGGKIPRAGVSPFRNVERFPARAVRFVRFTIRATTDGLEPCLDELELYPPASRVNVALSSSGVKSTASSVYPNSPIHRLEHINDGQHGNGRSWISAERGKGWVTLELPRLTKIDRIVWGRDREGRYRDRLAQIYTIEVSADGKEWSAVAGSTDRLSPGMQAPPQKETRALLAHRQVAQEQLARLTTPVTVYAGRFDKPDVVRLLARGDVMQPREEVRPGGIASLRIPVRLNIDSESSRRAALADWITHDDNPLTDRVMVNRLWHWHFGQGIVRTPSDFGFNGDRPSHPELLDWLVGEFRDSERTMKSLHRLIVLSAAYRQQSRLIPDAVKIDASNRLLWRMSARRLEAEAIRDGMLNASGALDRRMGGPGYDLWNYSNYVTVFEPKVRLEADTMRRMIYQFKPRLQQDTTFGAFDCPDATATMPRRNVSTTALQALNLLNDPFVLDQAERFAARVTTEAANREAQITLAFRLALGRSPEARELAAATRLVQGHGMVSLCRALFNANEFVYVP